MNRSRTPAPSPLRRAFTLVELLVVIFIIAGLVALLIPAVGRVRRASQGAATQAQLAAIATAIQSYYSDFRAYPGPLPNSDLGGYAYSTIVRAGILATGSTSGTTTTYTKSNFSDTNREQITGSENLVLGLLGGLEYDFTDSQVAYNPNAIFPSGATPDPKGPTNLNPNQPKRFAAYLQVKTGDISSGNFVDAALRPCTDSVIPEFLDKFPQAMPILYLRANPGATGVVTLAGQDESASVPANSPYQYDLAQVIGYTSSKIGTTANSALDHHGLQNIAPANPGVITDTIAADYANASKPGANALVYLKDPNSPANQPNGTANYNSTASPRQKDAFILISPGPDGVYGTPDDIVYPGSLNP